MLFRMQLNRGSKHRKKPKTRPILRIRKNQHTNEMRLAWHQVQESITELCARTAKKDGPMRQKVRYLRSQQNGLCVAICLANTMLTGEDSSGKIHILKDLLKALRCGRFQKKSAKDWILEGDSSQKQLIAFGGLQNNDTIQSSYWAVLIEVARACGATELVEKAFVGYADLSAAIFSYLNHRYLASKISPLQHSNAIQFRWFTEFRAEEIRRQLLATPA